MLGAEEFVLRRRRVWPWAAFMMRVCHLNHLPGGAWPRRTRWCGRRNFTGDSRARGGVHEIHRREVREIMAQLAVCRTIKRTDRPAWPQTEARERPWRIGRSEAGLDSRRFYARRVAEQCGTVLPEFRRTTLGKRRWTHNVAQALRAGAGTAHAKKVGGQPPIRTSTAWFRHHPGQRAHGAGARRVCGGNRAALNFKCSAGGQSLARLFKGSELKPEGER